MAGDIAAQLSAHGRATHGAIGVRASDAGGGPVVAAVDSGSAADRAGLRVDDRIVSIDGTRTTDTATLVYGLRRRPAGTRAVLGVERRGKPVRVAVTLDDAGATGATTLALSTGGTGG
jgi:S1-C subfamily serine protease